MVIYMIKHEFLTMDFTSIKVILCFPSGPKLARLFFCYGHNSVYPSKCLYLDIIKHK